MILVILSIIWGSSFILIKKGLIGLSPTQLGALRVIISAFFIFIFGLHTLKKIPKAKWKWLIVSGFLGTFFPVFLFAFAETEIDSSTTSILNSLVPLNTMLLGFAIFKISSSKRQVLGVIIGFSGTALLIMRMARRVKIYEGKAKILYEGPEPGTLVQYFKDDATAYNAEKKDVIDGKGVLNNRLSEFFMAGLNEIGVPTHFIKRLNMREQLVRNCEIIPLEVIVRNFAAGSICKRLGLEEGSRLPRPIVEYCYKDDALGDPLVTEEHIAAFGWATQQDMDDILSLALRVNDFISGIMLGAGIRLADFKIEIGRVYDGDFQRLVIADEISPDSCRLWDFETGQKLDKDVFRRDLGSLTDAYTEVARRLGVLPKNATNITKPTLIN